MRMNVRRVSDAEVLLDAQRFSTVQEWIQKSYRTYSIARKRRLEGLYEKCVKHMVPALRVIPPRITLNSIREAGRKFNSRGEWKHGDPSTYAAAVRRKMIEECCKHMTFIGHRRYNEWQVYRYHWPAQNAAYIGITSGPKRRHEYDHKKEGTVFKYAQLHGEPAFTVLHFPVNAAEARRLEIHYTEVEYPANGWTVINEAKAGSLGVFNASVWTNPKIKADADKFTSKTAWARASRSAYNAAKAAGIFDEVTAHMDRPSKVGQRVGEKRSDSAKAKMSEAAQLRAADPQWRAQHSARLKGRHITEEHRKAISDANKGHGRPSGWTLTEAEAQYLGWTLPIRPGEKAVLTEIQKKAIRRFRYQQNKKVTA